MAQKKKSMMVNKTPQDLYNKIFQWYGLQDYEIGTAIKNEKIIGSKGKKKTLTIAFRVAEGGTIVTIDMEQSLKIGYELNSDANMLISFISSLS